MSFHRHLALLALAALAGTAGGCAARTAPHVATLAEVLTERGFDPAEIVVPYEISDDMKAWVHASVPEYIPEKQKVQILLGQLLGPEKMALEYSGGYSGTAREVFDSHRANCLGFTHLFVGLAREIGLRVEFLRVRDVQSFNRDGDLVVVAGHMTVGYKDEVGETRILDFTAAPITYHFVQPISDVTAIALYYSNRGAEEMRAGRDTEALRWLERSVQIDPRLADGWVNLGVALRRRGDVAGAERCYRKALEADPDASSAYQNLATLLSLKGQREAAEEMLRVANRLQSRNPYTYLALGDWSLAQNRLDEARELYRRAYRLARKNADPIAALGQYELASGNRAKAEEWLRKAQSIDPANDRVVRLQERLMTGVAQVQG